MAFFKDKAGCPFCASTIFNVSLDVNDMPLTDEPSEPDVTLGLSCHECGNKVFLVWKTQGEQVSAVGLSVCRRCKQAVVKPPNAEGAICCSKCGGDMERSWWRGSGFTV